MWQCGAKVSLIVLLFLSAILTLTQSAQAENIYTTVVNVDDSAAGNTITFSYASHAFNADMIDVCNYVETADTLYVNFDGGNADLPSTDHVSVAIPHGLCYRKLLSRGIASINWICTSGQTCTGASIVAVQRVL